LNENFEKNKSMDIYSLGSLLWEIMSGKIPYSKNKDEGILQFVLKIKNEGYREENLVGFPSNYIELYNSCWNRNKSDRPKIDQVSFILKRITIL